MAKETFLVSRISCGHCIMTISDELNQLEGVRKVTGDEAKKTITVEWEAPATEGQIREALREINYPAD